MSANPNMFEPAEAPTAFPYSHGPWQIDASRTAYADPWIHVRRDDVTRPDGMPGSYAVISIKPGVCVIPIDQHGIVHLTKEFHYAVGRVTIEGVSGGIEVGHTAEEMAHRELEEELGIQAGKLSSLGSIDPFTASVYSPTTLYLAQDLHLGIAKPEATELIEHVRLPFSDAIEAVMTGSITHSPTCVALLKIMALRSTFGI